MRELGVGPVVKNMIMEILESFKQFREMMGLCGGVVTSTHLEIRVSQ
jgi:hypothetical protein